MMKQCPPLAVFALEKGPFNYPQWCCVYTDGRSFLPVIFFGETAESVEAKARTFWDTEAAKNRFEPPVVDEARSARMKALQADPAFRARSAATRAAKKAERVS
jgi:hypothetical protein